MMHKACSGTEESPIVFRGHPSNFQGHAGQKIANFDPNWAFADCNSSLNSPMAMKWCTELEIAQKRFPVVFQDYPSYFKVTRGKKWPILTPNRAFLDCNLSLSQRWLLNDAHDVALRRYPIVFQVQPSNFKVTRDKKEPILTPNTRFRTVTRVWIHRWLWNDTQSLK